MRLILSPAKNTRSARAEGLDLTVPPFREKTEGLAEAVRSYSAWELESLMKINPELAMKAYLDYQAFCFDGPGSPALLAYHGLAFRYLDAQSLSREELLFAQEHVRVLSAFYGVLRPLDEIMPYRLEFLCRLKMDGKDLYHYWADGIYRALFDGLADRTVINLCSAEYAKAVEPHLTAADRFVTCSFLSRGKNGKLQTRATAAKMARGRMVRFAVQNRIDSPEELWAFDWEDYAFCQELSTENNYVFLQP